VECVAADGGVGRPDRPRLLAQLLDDCEISRVVFGPDGQLLDIGTATRVWPVGMRRAIVERDRGCRFPGCDRRAEWCDIDHAIPWEDGGPTAVGNGLLLCRYHHRAKRRDGWWPTLHPDGTVTWTHADGRVRTDPAPSVIDDHVRTLLHATERDATNTHTDTDRPDRAPPHQHAAPGPEPPVAAA
jgi:HNH endonuclease